MEEISVRLMMDLTDFGFHRKSVPCRVNAQGRKAKCLYSEDGLKLDFSLNLYEKAGETCTTVSGVEICSNSEIIIIVVPAPVDT